MSAFFLAQILNENDSHLGRRFYHEKQPHARNFFNLFFRNLAMFVYFFAILGHMKQIFLCDSLHGIFYAPRIQKFQIEK